LKLLENPKELLAVLLITNNFVNVGIAIISSVLIEMMLGPANKGNETMRFLIEVIGITFTMLMLGEVIPKIYSSRNSVRTAKMMAFPISTFKSIPPISWLKNFLVHGTNLIQKNAKQRSVKITSDELEHALALTKEESTSEEEHKILEGIVKFGNTEACQVMRSRMDVVAIDESANYKELLELILDAGYSRVPVFNGSIDNVTGILYIKDLLPHLSKDESFKWQELTRKPFFIPENKKIDDLLKEFQEKKMHMAVVVDEYGGASGVVTLEDVLEEIVGDITDEFDDAEILHKRVDENTFLIEGKIALNDFYKILDIDGKDFDSIKGESDSLGGFIIENAGRILKNKEYFICSNVKLIVESSDKKRIKMIKVVVLNTSSES
jgi:gliding motility-associated protein GldE